MKIPKYLYHATYKYYLPSIKKFGLNPKKNKIKTWDISEDNMLYLADDPYIAESYAEAADDVPDYIYDTGIIVFRIKTSDLIFSKLSYDANNDDMHNYQYNYYIRSNKLKIIKIE